MGASIGGFYSEMSATLKQDEFEGEEQHVFPLHKKSDLLFCFSYCVV